MSEPYDIAIIGGGISGIGAALAATEAHKRVVLFEGGVCCGATSNNSLRIIHGGLRYFQTADISRVVRSIKDQAYWLSNAPDYILPLSSMFALRRRGLKSRLPMWAAGIVYQRMYSMFSERTTLAGPVTLAEAEALAPALAGSMPHGAFVWQDALVSDLPRFTALLKDRLLREGAEVRERHPVQVVRRTSDGYRIEPYGIAARSVITTLGPWFGSLHVEGIDLGRGEFPAGWCKAFNLVLNRPLCGKAAFAVHATQGRMFFLVPRATGVTALGTWYEPWIGAPEQGQPTEPEIERFLAACNKAFPSAALQRKDISEIEWGILPMRDVDEAGPRLYGSHKIRGSGRYAEVMSTKYTTFLSQGRELVARISTG